MKSLVIAIYFSLFNSVIFCQNIDSLIYLKNTLLTSKKKIDSTYLIESKNLTNRLYTIDSIIFSSNQTKGDDSIVFFKTPIKGITRNTAVILLKPDTYSDIIGRVKDGDTVDISSLVIGKREYIYAKINNGGYIDLYFFKLNDQLKYSYDSIIETKNQLIAANTTKYIDSINKEKIKEEEKEKLKLVNEKARLLKTYGAIITDKILKKIIYIGMRDEVLIETIGWPQKVNRSVYSFGVHEQWVYGDGDYFYFENGKLTSWSDSR